MVETVERKIVTLVNGKKHTDKATEGKRCRDVSTGERETARRE